MVALQDIQDIRTFIASAEDMLVEAELHIEDGTPPLDALIAVKEDVQNALSYVNLLLERVIEE